MKVTALIRAYNHEAYIAQTIESALAQQATFDFEILVGDDCSTDGTREIVCTYAARHPERIRTFLPEKNIGRHRMLAEMIAACRGEYVAWLDGDDYWTQPNKLQRQADYLDAHRECSACFHPVLVIYDDGSHEPHRTHHPDRREQFTLADIVQGGFHVPTCSYFFRREAVGKLPDWFYTLAMADLPMEVLIAQRGNAGFIDEEMGAYRVHPGGIWSAGMRAKQWSAEQTRRKMEGYIHFYWTINRVLDGRFESAIRDKVSMLNYDTVWAYQKEGNTRMMRHFLIEAARAKLLNPYTPTSYVVKAWIFACVPLLARLRKNKASSN